MMAIVERNKKRGVIKLERRQKERLSMRSYQHNKEDIDKLKEELKNILIRKKSM